MPLYFFILVGSLFSTIDLTFANLKEPPSCKSSTLNPPCSKKEAPTPPLISLPDLKEASLINLLNGVESDQMRQKIEGYMNGLQMLSCHFIQVDRFQSKGPTIKNQPSSVKSITKTGMFYMIKPDLNHYKISIDFPQSNQRMLVINNNMAIMDTQNQKILSKTSLASTPIAQVFSNHFSIQKQFNSPVFYELPEEHILFTNLRPKNGYNLTISLFFKLYANHSIEKLIGWVLHDPRGNSTEVQLLPQSFIVNNPSALPPNIFEWPQKKQPVPIHNG